MGPAGFGNMGNLEYSGRDSHTGRPSPAGRHFSFSNVLGLGDRVSLSIFCCTSVCQYFSKNSILTTPWCFFVCRCLTTTLTLPDYDVKCTFISARNFLDVWLSQKLDYRLWGLHPPFQNSKIKESNKTKQKIEDNPLEKEKERKSCLFV